MVKTYVVVNDFKTLKGELLCARDKWTFMSGKSDHDKKYID